MNNIYYTPDIEEFCIGFELEYLGDRDEYNNKWHKLKISNSNDLDFVINGKPSDRFRVKYLNQEDIKSLGFKDIKNNIFESTKDNYLSLTYFKGNKGWYLNYGENESEFAFVGWIKNKFELKKLLRQLK